jgi:serine/threonine protein kinase
MEYAVNGNLFKQMKKQGSFTEKDAFNIFTQTSLGIDFLHKNKIIHRDLKPENLLLDKKRTIKLCDFGWSAESNNDCRFTLCGTVDYMAPEMVKGKPINSKSIGQGYSYAVDIWCLGVLLYELLHGYVPFSGKDQGDTMKKIRNKEEIKFHEGLSQSVKDLISNLLTYDQYQRPNLDYIFSHSWVQEFEKTFKIDLNGIRSNYSKKFMGNKGKSSGPFNARENRQTQQEFQGKKSSFDKILTPKKEYGFFVLNL